MASQATPANEKINTHVGMTPVGDGGSPTTPSALDDDNEVHGTTEAKKGLFARVSDFFGNWYYLSEVGGLIIAAMSIISICIVVDHYDDEPLPSWSRSVYIPMMGKKSATLTLNSLLSILSVLGSVCVMIPVTKGLGQLKYLWFIQKDRRLADLEMFDSASRSKFGSAQLIWKLRLKHLAVFGGFASLLVLANGPFVQNLIVVSIGYGRSNDTSHISYVPEAAWDNSSGILGNGASMKYHVGLALADDDDDWIIPPHKCPTGECDWEGYYTLAACTRCADISHELKTDCTPHKAADLDTPASGGCKMSLSNGLSTSNIDTSTNRWELDPSRTVMVMNTTLEPFVYKSYQNHFVTVQMIMVFDPDQPQSTFNDGVPLLKPYMITEKSKGVATECAILPCVQNQSFFLTSNPDYYTLEPTLEINREWINFTYEAGTGRVNFPEEADVDTQTPAQLLVSHNPIFGNAWYQSIRDWLRLHLSGFAYFSNSGAELPQALVQLDGQQPSPEIPLQNILINSYTNRWGKNYCVGMNNATISNFECAMHKLSAGITNAMRVASWEVADANQRLKTSGQSWVPIQFCHAQWRYISLPIIVWVLALVLFVGVVVKTRRANIKAWRTNPLATLLLRLDPESREQLKDWQRMGDAQLRDTAEQLRLRLKVDDDGPPRFVKE